MVLQLLRTYHEQGTNGELFLNGKKICDTIELPWRDNRQRISCIPEGTYTLRKRYTTRFRLHIYVENVPNREWILIHTFNNAPKESLGCIAPVEKLEGVAQGGPSRPALNRILSLLEPAFAKKESVFLMIKENDNAKLPCRARAKADTKVL